MINTEYDAFRMDSKESYLEQNRIETSLNLSDSHFDKILSASGAVFSPFIETSANEIRYGGRITFNVIYLSDGYERLEVGAEFSFKKQGDFNFDSATVNYTLGEITLKKNNGLLYAETVLSAHILGETGMEKTFLAGCDVLKKQSPVVLYEKKKGELSIDLDDEFECDKLKNVLFSQASAVVNRTECNYGNVLVEGEVFLSLSLLPFLPNSDIVKERRCIPFSIEVETPSIGPDSISYAVCQIEKLSLKVYTSVDGEKSTVNTIVGLKIFTECEQKVEKIAVTDAYSTACEVEIVRVSDKAKRLLGEFVRTEKIDGKFICQIPENSRFVTATGETVEIVDSEVSDGVLKIDAIIYADMIFVDGEGEVVSKKGELTLSFAMDGSFDFASDVSMCLSSLSVKFKNGQLLCDGAVKITAKKLEEYIVEYIEEILEGQEKVANSSAISVYLGQSGDDEWAIEKEFGVSIDEIYALNPDLEFPLSGGEKIIYYRQK